MTETTGRNKDSETGPDYSGIVNSAGSLFLNGWAVTRSGDPCQVRVFVNGEEAFDILSEEARPHLKRQGVSNGLGGWSVDLRKVLKPGPNRVDVRFPDGTSLRKSPYIHHAPSKIRALKPGETRLYQGDAALIDDVRIDGWVMGTGGDTAVVTIHVNGREPVSFLPDQPRIAVVDGVSRTVFGWSMDLGDVLMRGMNLIHVRDAEGQPLGESPFRVRVAAPAKAAPAVPEPAPAPAPVPAEPVAPPAPPVAEPPVAQAHGMPSAADLDEMSLDDISLAMAAGMVEVEPPVAPPVPEVVARPAPEPVAPRFNNAPGFFERLLRRLP
ncbi:hypothetical protein ACG3SL_03240 [Sphingomonas sp. CJ20]